MPPRKVYTERQVVQLMHRGVVEAGGLSAYARKIGIGHTYVSNVLNGYQGPGPKLIEAMGLEICYREKRRR